MNLTVVRHGQTIENAQGIIMGQLGGTLSEKGVKQAEDLSLQLKNEKFDQVWSSDLKRCIETAERIMKFHQNLELKLTPALREVNFGKFQGSPDSEIRPFFEQKHFLTWKPQGGESLQEKNIRVVNFVNKLFKGYPGQDILLITHTGPIEAIRSVVEKTPFESDAPNASALRFKINEPLRLSF
jgi:broad specificity phosphatase PhoE